MFPLLTIGIPTYNRPEFLKESLASAIAQTYPHVEVVVSDNSSDDASERVVAELGQGRVRYNRNPTNIGGVANFLKTLELARGEYFAWLQDDDLLFHDFVARAVVALDAEPDAVAYLAFAVCSRSTTAVSFPALYGPPVPLDWLGGRPRTVPGAIITPLSLLVSVGIPPVILFRTATLRRHQALLSDSKLPLYVERTLLSALAADGAVVCAPHVAGFFRLHPDQYHVTEKSIRGAELAQWTAMAGILDQLTVRGCSNDATLLAETLAAVPADSLSSWLIGSKHWPTGNRLCAQVRASLERAAQERSLSFDRPSSRFTRLTKAAVRDLVPPIVLSGLTGARGAVRKLRGW